MLPQFEGENADEVWRLAAEQLSLQKPERASRGGMTRELLHCQFHLRNPRQRWILSRLPSMNPAFAIAEIVWILLGRNDSAFVNYWNPILPKFAGNGTSYHGAYGHRLRHAHGIDQIHRAYQALSANPNSRQVVLHIWSAHLDLPCSDGTPQDKDIPCNICSLLKIKDGRLEWFQVMRSNDLFRGTPHNFVQFTTLQEILAGWLSLEVGSYVQLSDSLHIYENDSEFYISKARPAIINTDNLALPKTEFDRALKLVGNSMDELRRPELSRERFLDLVIKRNDLPQAWHNLLRITAADAARRRKWSDCVAIVIAECDNPVLAYLWNGWIERHKSKNHFE